MSSSKGLGSGAAEMLEILPPELLRFLMVKTKLNLAINFDPAGNTIPDLFDDYQEFAKAFEEKTDSDKARIFELSQVNDIKLPPKIRFSTLAQWVQMPNMQEQIRKEKLFEWAKYASIWVERFAPDSTKYTLQQEVPAKAKNLSVNQKKFLMRISKELEKDWDGENFQREFYEWAKELELSSHDAFAAVYQSLLNKDYGPKAGWLILSLDKKFVIQRFTQDIASSDSNQELRSPLRPRSEASKNYELRRSTKIFDKTEIFSIAKDVAKKYPSITCGIAVIKGVTIEEKNEELNKDKEGLLKSLEGLTTEKLGGYPEIQSYRKMYRAMGVDWHSRRPSPEALLRRVALQKGVYTVNTCVDAYNLVVKKNRISVGAFDLDKIQFPTILRFPKMGEEILLLGDSESTPYKPSEVSYFDQNGGYNINFNYRDAQRTAVQLTTKNLYINVDGIFDISSKQVEQALHEATGMITKYCGGTVEEFGIVTAP